MTAGGMRGNQRRASVGVCVPQGTVGQGLAQGAALALAGVESRPRTAMTPAVGMPSVVHDRGRYANNRAELSHQPTRQRERQMRRFKWPEHAQRFFSIHGIIQHLFRLGRHLVSAANHRMLRERSFRVWRQATSIC